MSSRQDTVAKGANTTPSVIHQLGPIADDPTINIGWIIGRPIVASAAMAILTPLLCKFLFSPLFRRYLETTLAKFKHASNAVLMTLVLSAFLAIASYAGASVLYGSFLAGAFLSGLPSTHPEGPFSVGSREEGEVREGKTPGFVHSFERFLGGAQASILQPLFFASIGFAIPFTSLWTGKAIWRGVVATLLMVVAKVCSLFLPRCGQIWYLTLAGCRWGLRPHSGPRHPPTRRAMDKLEARDVPRDGHGRPRGDRPAHRTGGAQRDAVPLRGGVHHGHVGHHPEYHHRADVCWAAAGEASGCGLS